MKITNKILSIILSLIILLGVVPVTAGAVEYTGKCGDNLTYSFDESTGVLTILGTGEMKNYRSDEISDNRPWKNWANRITAVCIGEGVTSIGNAAFRQFKYLESVVIPDSVKVLGEYAFSGCANLTALPVGNGVEKIGKSAFIVCTGLKAISIPDSVLSIGNTAFYGCTSLEAVSIPDNIVSIGEKAFFNCELESVTISRNVKKIGENAFPILSTIYYSGTQKQWRSLEKENDYSFTTYHRAYCSDGVLLPSGSCGDNLIWSFDDVTGMLTIDGMGDMDDFTYYTDIEWTSADTRPWGIFYIKKVIINEGVNSIGDFAFEDKDFTSITLPKSLKTIGYRAFYKCKGLNEVVIPENVTTIGSSAFAYSALRKVVIQGVTEIPYQAFYCSYSLSEVVISGSVTKISDRAFLDCEDLTEIVIPEGVTEIGKHAFQDTGIEKIWLPVSLSVLDRKSLESTPLTKSGTPLTNIYYAGKPSQWSNMKYNYYEFYTPHYSCRSEETASTCTTQGSITYFCDCCGASKFCKKLVLAPHNYAGDEIPATCTKHGITNYACEECEAHYWAYTSNPTGHTFNEEGVCESCGEKEIVNNPSSSNTQLLNFESIFALIMNLLQKIFSVFTVPTV